MPRPSTESRDPDEDPLVHSSSTPSSPPAAPPLSADAERRRADAVRSTGLMDVEAGERIDRIARQAARITGAPMALVSLIDEQRQWNPGVHGEGTPREGNRDFSMCSAAIESGEPYVVEDAATDPRWSDTPGVVGDPHIRFYAGQPIDDGEGNLIGVLCVIDTKPRRADDDLLQTLADLAVWARHELLAGRAAATGDDAGAADRAAMDRLRELERLQSLVVSTTAHELRTPLTVLRVHADLLTSAAEDLGPEERSSLEAIARAVARLQDVSDGLVSDLRGSAGGAEEALRRWLQLERGSQRLRPGND